MMVKVGRHFVVDKPPAAHGIMLSRSSDMGSQEDRPMTITSLIIGAVKGNLPTVCEFDSPYLDGVKVEAVADKEAGFIDLAIGDGVGVGFKYPMPKSEFALFANWLCQGLDLDILPLSYHRIAAELSAPKRAMVLNTLGDRVTLLT